MALGAERSEDFETGLTVDDRLELRVWLRLLTCSNMIELGVRRGLREAFEITLPRFDLLAQLDRAPDGLTMGELSRRLMVTNGNVTGLIDRLVGEGLVARQPSPSDRRAHMVRLTDGGKAAFDGMTPAHRELVAGCFKGLKRAELRELYGLLGKLKEAFDDKERAAADAPGKNNAKGRTP
jgi:DNA-binding MarR family transcriptional regulator